MNTLVRVSCQSNFSQFYSANKDGDLIAQRYRTLKRLLDELGY
ncbi:hypothetical protein [Enterococcus avium]